MEAQLKLDLFTTKPPRVLGASVNSKPPIGSLLYEAPEAGLPSPGKSEYFGEQDRVPVPSFFSTYIANARPGHIRFPVVPSFDCRAEKIGAMKWLGYSNSELVCLSLGEEEVFRLVCGFTCKWDVPKSAYIAADGQLDLRLDGWRRVRSKVAHMRRAWASYWRTSVGLDIREDDDLLSRYFYGRLLNEYGRCLMVKGISFDTEARLDGLFTRVKEEQLLYPRIRTFAFEDATLGKEISVRFDDELQRQIYTFGARATAASLVPSVEVWMHRIGRATLPLELRPTAAQVGSLSGESQDYGKVQAYVAYMMKGVIKHRFKRLFGMAREAGSANDVEPIGRGKFQVFGSEVKVDVEGLAPSRLSTLPTPFVRVFVEWCDKVRGAFQEFGSLGNVCNLRKLGSDNRRLLEHLGFEFTDASFTAKLSDDWYTYAADTLKQKIQRETVLIRETLLCRSLMKELVSMYMDAVGLKSQFRLVVEKDDTFGQRVCLAGDYKRFWLQIEKRAGRELAVTAAKAGGMGRNELTSVNWGESGDRRPFVDRWFRSGFEESFPNFYPEVASAALREQRASWFRELRELWARGIVVLEGSMRAYLRSRGFLLKDTNGKPQEFWAGLPGVVSGGPAGGVPKWRWLLLREAYLAAYVWAWSQLLYAKWIPLDVDTVRRYRSALSVYGAMVGAYGRGSGAVPHWDGKPVRVDGGTFEPSQCFEGLSYDRHILNRLSVGGGIKDHVGFAFGGKDFEVPVSGRGINGFDSVPVIAPLLNMHLGGRFTLDEKGSWTFHADGPRDNGSVMVGVLNETMTRSIQLAGQWFLAGESRYGSLYYGTALVHWFRNSGFSQNEQEKLAGGLAAWAPFGVLGYRDWASTPGIASLFTDARAAAAEIDWVSARGIPDFADWVGLGSRGIVRAWGVTEKAPLSFPMARVESNQHHTIVEGCSSFLWFDRTLRAIGSGLDPVMCQPLTHVDYPGFGDADKREFLKWRRQIWAPIIAGGGFDTPGKWGVMDTQEPVFLCKPVRSLWRSWLKHWLHHDGGGSVAD